jgi:hypothetical protein
MYFLCISLLLPNLYYMRKSLGIKVFWFLKRACKFKPAGISFYLHRKMQVIGLPMVPSFSELLLIYVAHYNMQSTIKAN